MGEVGAPVADGVYPITFTIYDTENGGEALKGWSEVHASVSVISGIVNVILGGITPLDDPDKDGDRSDAISFLSAAGPRFLGITINNGQEMLPRHRLVPSFHARMADVAESLIDDRVNTSTIVNSAVTTEKLNDGAITANKLAIDSVTADAIADDAISSTEIADGEIQLADLDQSIQSTLSSSDALPVGTILQSLLTEAQYLSTVGNTKWVLADGRDITGSDFHNLTGTATAPDLRAMFLRGHNGARNDEFQDTDPARALGDPQEDDFASHSHDVLGTFWNISIFSTGNIVAGTVGRPPCNGPYNCTPPDQVIPDKAAPRGGAETRPNNVAVNYFIKINN